MRRYSNKELNGLSPNRFAVDVLQDEAKGRDPYQPTTKKLRESIAYLHVMEETGIPFSLLRDIFKAWEAAKPSRHLTAAIVFKSVSFPASAVEKASIVKRIYLVSSDSPAFQPGTGTAIRARCLDGFHVTADLAWHMEGNAPGKTTTEGWKVEACYLLAPDFAFPSTFD